MPYSVAGKNNMLNCGLRNQTPSISITHVGLLDADTDKAVTGVASTDIFTSTSHGYSAGDLVLFSALTGGTGMVAGRPYYVIAANLAANTFQVSNLSGGSSIDFTTNLTAGTVTRLVEISGGSPAYARVAITFSAAADGVIDDSTNGATLNVPTGATVDYVSFHSASTAGTLLGIDDVASEPFTTQSTYTVSDAKLDLNSA